jgi:hypothetical protein
LQKECRNFCSLKVQTFFASTSPTRGLKMARSSLLLFSVCAAASLLAEEVAINEEVAMLKVAPCDDSTSNGPKDRVSVLESQMQEVFTDTVLGDFGAKAASARPQIRSNRWFIKTDAFLWKHF